MPFYLRVVDVSNHKYDFPADVADYDGIVAIVTYGAGEMTINGIIDGVWPGGDPMIQAAIARGKKFGFMHYIRGVGADNEAEFFNSNTVNYVTHGVPSFDWEPDDNDAWGNTDYLREVVRRYIELTGVPPHLYTSQGYSEGLREVASEFNCGVWIAQYATEEDTTWEETPWNEGAYSCCMRQYTSHGYIDGYGGRLDLNKFYGDEATWDKYANPNGVTPTPEPTPEPQPEPELTAPTGTTLQLAEMVMLGQFGDDDERRKNLGSRYDEVQNFIDHIYSSSVETLADEAMNGVYGNNPVREHVLGDRYEAVQAEIDRRYNEQDTTPDYTIYIVQSGDTLSDIAVKFNTTYEKIAADNGIDDPNLIYPGQQLTIK